MSVAVSRNFAVKDFILDDRDSNSIVYLNISSDTTANDGNLIGVRNIYGACDRAVEYEAVLKCVGNYAIYLLPNDRSIRAIRGHYRFTDGRSTARY